MGMILAVENLAFSYSRRRIGENISFTLNRGEVLCLLGPNGTGKTTLFRTLLGLLKPDEGKIVIDNIPLKNLSASHRAKKLAYVPQGHSSMFPFNVIDIVLMGRAAHLSFLGTPSRHDRVQAYEYLDRFNMMHLSDRPYTDISGGERQIVLIARALMQEAEIIIMDEPTASLDYGNQIKVLTTIRQLTQSGIAVLFSTHSPDQAFLCADQVALMNNGTIGAIGKPGDILTADALKALYKIDVVVGTLPGQSHLVCSPVLQGS